MVTHVGDVGLLRAYLDQGTFQLRLFVNDVTPQKTDSLSTYTEAVGSGYAAIPLASGLWAVIGPPPVATYAQRTFVFTGALGLVYGYMIGAPDGSLFGAERFTNGPYDIRRNGDLIRVTPTVVREV